MRILIAVLTAALGAGVVHAGGDPVAVYGYISKVKTEPESGRPERVEIWGTFSVAAPGTASDYQAPEHGYLYFDLSADSAAGAAECARLQSMIGKIGVVAFGRRGMAVRVRTADEKLDHPATYRFGSGAELVGFDKDSPAVRELGRLPKVFGQVSYGLVERVVLEPNAGKPERIQIWGLFAMGVPEEASFTPPQRGYLYLTLPSGEGGDWKSIAGNRQLVGFRSPFLLKMRVRNPDEKPQDPDTIEAYRTPISVFAVRADTEYAPVRALLATR